MYQVSPVAEGVEAEEEVYLNMDKVKEEDVDMEKVEVEKAVEAVVVAVAVVVETVEEEAIKIFTTTIEGRITIMELIHWILQGTLHMKNSQLLFKLMYGTIFMLDKEQRKGVSIIMMIVISQQE